MYDYRLGPLIYGRFTYSPLNIKLLTYFGSFPSFINLSFTLIYLRRFVLINLTCEHSIVLFCRYHTYKHFAHKTNCHNSLTSITHNINLLRITLHKLIHSFSKMSPPLDSFQTRSLLSMIVQLPHCHTRKVNYFNKAMGSLQTQPPSMFYKGFYPPPPGCVFVLYVCFFVLFFETEDQQASAKAQEAVDHLTSFPSSREVISQLGIQLPTFSLRFGCLSTNIQQFRVVSNTPLLYASQTMASITFDYAISLHAIVSHLSLPTSHHRDCVEAMAYDTFTLINSFTQMVP